MSSAGRAHGLGQLHGRSSIFEEIAVLGKTFEQPNDVTAGGRDFQAVRACMVDHRVIELTGQAATLSFPRYARVVYLDVTVSRFAVGHDGIPPDGEFTMGRCFPVFNLQLVVGHFRGMVTSFGGSGPGAIGSGRR